MGKAQLSLEEALNLPDGTLHQVRDAYGNVEPKVVLECNGGFVVIEKRTMPANNTFVLQTLMEWENTHPKKAPTHTELWQEVRRRAGAAGGLIRLDSLSEILEGLKRDGLVYYNETTAYGTRIHCAVKFIEGYGPKPL